MNSLSWTGSGQLIPEHYDHGGNLRGPHRQWYRSGQPRPDASHEHGYCRRSTRWSEDDRQLEEVRWDPTSPVADELAERRKRRTPEIIDIGLKTWDFVERAPRLGR